MAKAIAQGNLVAITELMVQASGCQVQTIVVREQAAVGFKLVDNVRLERIGGRIDGEDIVENPSTNRCGQRGLASQARDRGRSQASQSGKDRALVIKYVGFRPEDTGIGQQRHRVLRIAQKTFKRTIEERLV